MKTLLSIVRAECIKLKHTSLFTIAIWVAIMPVAMIALIYLSQSDANTVWRWPAFASSVMQIWLQLIMALFIGAMAAQYLGIEHTSNAWKLLFSTPPSKRSIVLAKWLVLTLLVLVSFLAVTIALYGGGALLQAIRPHAALMPQAFTHIAHDLLMYGGIFIAALGIVTIQYALAFAVRTMSLPIMVAVAGFMAATMAAGRELLLHLLPWSWPYQLYLQATHGANAKVAIGYTVAASLVVTIVVLGSMMMYINKRDEL